MARNLVLGSFALCALFLVGCTDGSKSSDSVSLGHNIQGGTTDHGDPAVGLVWFQGGGFCTGTLISPTVVLTAGHCVQHPIDGFYTGDGSPQTNVTATPPPGMVKHATDKMANHPSYQSGTCPNTTYDLGLIHLAAPVTNITPVAFATASSPANSTTCQAVGFGTHDESGTTTYEEKRTGTEIVQGGGSTYVTVKVGTGLADRGDSGGPLICGGLISGATSCHTDGSWPGHQIEYYARVDSAADWIVSTLNAWDPGSFDGGTGNPDGGTSMDGGF